MLLVQGHKLITANIGNSRSILVDKYRKFRILTEDHNVMPLTTGAPTSAKHSKQSKSIARCFGEFNAHKSGQASCEPDIKHFNLDEDDQILILASDGIWKHMTVHNVAQIAQAHYEMGQAEAAANAIVRRAT